MPTLYYMKNTIQHYDWGSLTALPEILGEPNSENLPMAELWMGAHPKAPSTLLIAGAANRPITELIAENPQGMLGPDVVGKFGPSLPFLFKVLTAAKPLSIQAHPNLEQARKGFDRENAASSPIRVYADRNHKPELLCALTPFVALCGFREAGQIQSNLGMLQIPQIDALTAPLSPGDPQILRDFFSGLMQLPPEDKAAVTSLAVERAAQFTPGHAPFVWLQKLHATYGNDIGILSPLFLNLVHLMPGEALYLSAGVLHSYLEGAGMEIMASSDNVLRGGLTRKHMDIEELIQVLTFDTAEVPILQPQSLNAAESIYKTPAEEFQLSVLTPDDNHPAACAGRDRPEILFCASGNARISGEPLEKPWELRRGQSIFVPAEMPRLSIEGQAQIFRASVP